MATRKIKINENSWTPIGSGSIMVQKTNGYDIVYVHMSPEDTPPTNDEPAYHTLAGGIDSSSMSYPGSETVYARTRRGEAFLIVTTVV